jgi:hypothetical protein
MSIVVTLMVAAAVAFLLVWWFLQSSSRDRVVLVLGASSIDAAARVAMIPFPALWVRLLVEAVWLIVFCVVVDAVITWTATRLLEQLAYRRILTLAQLAIRRPHVGLAARMAAFARQGRTSLVVAPVRHYSEPISVRARRG